MGKAVAKLENNCEKHGDACRRHAIAVPMPSAVVMPLATLQQPWDSQGMAGIIVAPLAQGLLLLAMNQQNKEDQRKGDDQY